MCIRDRAKAGPPPSFSSVLMRKPHGGRVVRLVKGWQRFIHVLDESGLAWFDNEEAAKHMRARGRIAMHELHGAEAMDYKGPSRFVVHARAREGNRSIELSAESPALMHRWIELIGRHMHAHNACLLYTSPSPRDRQKSRMPSSA